MMDSGKLAQCLSSDHGWSFSQAVDWLYGEGQEIAEPAHFTDALCLALLRAGVPLYCLRIAFHTLHPQVAACAFTWSQDRDATEFCLLHEDAERNDLDSPELDNRLADEVVDRAILPLGSPIGKKSVLSIFTNAGDGFSAEDIVKFEVFANLLAPTLKVIALRRITTTLLDTYIGHRSGDKVLNGLIKRGDGETIEAVIWYCDLRDFTLLTESLAADQLLSMLNTYFETIADSVGKRGGEILRFIGDAMLIVFPVQDHRTVRKTCETVLDAATEILHNLETLNQNRQTRGEPAIRFGIGLHIGQVIYGNVGAPDRLDFTVMGAAVNRTARIESLTKETGITLLFSDDIASLIDRSVRSLGKYAIRGVTNELEIFSLAPDDALVSNHS